MPEDSAIREELRGIRGWSRSNLSNRVTRLVRTSPMSRQHALYVLAHQAGISLERFGVSAETLREVARIISALTEHKAPRETTTPQQSPNGTAAVQSAASTTPAQRFAARDLHPDVIRTSRRLYTAGQPTEAVRAAFQGFNNRVKRLLDTNRDGKDLMGWALNDQHPRITLSDRQTVSERSEHEGFRFLAQGAMLAGRNPRSHEVEWPPDGDDNSVLELLGLASYLHRCLDRADVEHS